MSYINQFDLIKAFLFSKVTKLNSNKLIATVDRQQIFNKFQKDFPELSQYEKFYITDDQLEDKDWLRIKEDDKTKILILKEKVQSSLILNDVIVKLRKYKEMYPNIPAIYNYLGLAYERANMPEKRYNILIETRKKFPDYIFGKISMVEYYLNKREHKKIAGLLGNKFEITQHAPKDTSVFHVSAVRGFYYVVGCYLARINHIEGAYKAYFLLSDLDVKHKTTEILGDEIVAYELLGLKKKMGFK